MYKKYLFICCTWMCCALISNTVLADDKTSEPSPLTAQQLDEVLTDKFRSGSYSKKGADTCLKCHDAESQNNAMGIFNNIHGNLGVSESPFAKLQCEACHGPDGKHSRKVRKGNLREPMISFGIDSLVDADKQNSVCLSCHEDRKRLLWQGSSHQSEQVPCAACHQLHQSQDPILVKQSQNKLCGSCHSEQLQAITKRSSHPLTNGVMACSDCHNPHGAIAESALVKSTINSTCYSCHEEKRGPVLWEHAPVVEDCSICHDAHGSINRALLKQRTPQLCLDCHSPDVHSSTISSGANFIKNNQSAYAIGQNCLNCHNVIHGSNHPAGQTFQR